MTIEELARVTESAIRIKDGKDSKVLCYQYRPIKHAMLNNRNVLSIWSEIEVVNSGYTSRANSIICVYVEHKGRESQ